MTLTDDQIEKLKLYCLQPQMALKEMLEKELQAMGRETVSQDGFLYSPGSHPILLVAHMDTVHEKQRGMPTDIYIDETDPDSPQGDLRSNRGVGGDDRAGCFIVMEIIKTLDCHVVFCEDEEIHGVGAGQFCDTNIRPDVQFIVEFDRKKRDHAVFYDCHNEDFIKFVTSFGYIEEIGSYSDISEIAPHLNIAAVNLSTGYYNAHSTSEYIRIHEVGEIIEQAIPLLTDIFVKYEYI